MNRRNSRCFSLPAARSAHSTSEVDITGPWHSDPSEVANRVKRPTAIMVNWSEWKDERPLSIIVMSHNHDNQRLMRQSKKGAILLGGMLHVLAFRRRHAACLHVCFTHRKTGASGYLLVFDRIEKDSEKRPASSKANSPCWLQELAHFWAAVPLRGLDLRVSSRFPMNTGSSSRAHLVGPVTPRNDEDVECVFVRTQGTYRYYWTPTGASCERTY